VASNKTKSTAQLTAYSKDTQVLAKGQQLFQTYCSPCHNFLQAGIGPSLEQLTATVDPIWIKKFIRNAPELIEQGDARAKQLFAEYKQLMPPFTNLKEAELEAITSYIHSQQKAPVQPQQDLGIELTDPIPTKIAKSGLQLHIETFTKAPSTAAKAPLARINQMRVLKGGQQDRLFVHDLRGILYELIGNTWQVAFDIKPLRPHFIDAPGMGTGLGSFAFHPEFYQNGLFYTTHTEPAKTAPADFAYADSIKVSLQWVLTEWKIKDPQASLLSGSSRTLLRVNMVTGIHGVQEIAFNPLSKKGDSDYGLLYIGVGDGGSSENGFPFLCNDKKHIWGSLLRIDPQGKNSKNGQYGIPSSNPYAQWSDAAACREIFCRGFRNPNRFTWAPDGRLLISDIGHFNCEELNQGLAGADYGWPEREGTFVINPRAVMKKVYALPADDARHNYVYPLLQFDHDEGKAIEGGFVYEGSAVPQLRGKYIFGDIALGRIFFVELDQLKLGQQATIQEMDLQMGGAPVTLLELNKGIKPDFRLGIGLNRELYIYTKSDGQVYKVVDCRPKR
jgi:glucose/arabinose dehydrogenase/mono/diheme cytochrome c family protein